jgi:hypothetical protein
MLYFNLDCLTKCKIKHFVHFHDHLLKFQCRTWCSQTISKDCYKFHKNKKSFIHKWHKYKEFSFIPIDCAADVQENHPRIYDSLYFVRPWCVEKVSNLWSAEIHLLIWRYKPLIPFQVVSLVMHTLLPALPPLLETLLKRVFWNGDQPGCRIPHDVFSWLKSGSFQRHFQPI